ncbi:putative oxidoreductase [Rathayibacter tanaceti]|uniref:Putative oxidoreductase n=1 Tax=Rathayibacter tanaceti TaxID=1671680 RepID=A0A166ICN4_9MICO|nr:putative oxidoreductase [Rathayibacter tanaceti]
MFDINVFGVIRVTNAVLPVMRAQQSGRIVNLSSIVGLMPQPYMAIYSSTKFAIEGYSESLDHELREYGVRVLLVEPAWTSTAFEANALPVDRPIPAYEARRAGFAQYMAGAVSEGDAPAAVARQVVAAATDRRPRLRYPVGRTAGVAVMRRLAPAGVFDRQLRRANNLPA